MKKKSILITLATFGLLLSGLVGCGKQPVEPSESSKPEETSQKSEKSSEDKPSTSVAPSSSEQPSSSEAPAHEHSYAKVGESVKNADQKDVYVMECAEHDDKYIGIAFKDYSAKDADFDSGANASKYGEVDAAIWEDAYMLAKTAGTSISWKINVDKAIEGAKLSFGVTSTYASHGDQSCDGKYQIKVNDGEAATWLVTGTFDDNGMSPTKRNYLIFQNINLVAGENTITLIQTSTGYRWLFGGEMRIHYSGDAKPVEAPVPFPGYNVTFSVEHCKVLVFSTKAYTTETPVETLTCVAKDENGNVVAYDPDDQDPQPQVSFKVVCDEGYSCTVNNITVAPKANYKNLKQNPDSQPDQDDIFRITKVQGDITVTIAPAAGVQAKGYKISFVPTNCTIKVYVGPKNELGDNLDTAEDGFYYARAKEDPYAISFTTPQVNFEVVCDAGYEFVPTITDNKVDFITHPDSTKDGYNKFSDKGGYYNLTKVDDDLTITITATSAQAPLALPVGSYHGLAKMADGTLTAADLSLESDKMSLYVGEAFLAQNISDFVWDGVNKTLTTPDSSNSWAMVLSYEENIFTLESIASSSIAGLFDSTYAVKLSGNCQFLGCEEDTATLQNIFLRRKMESTWVAANADDKIFSSTNSFRSSTNENKSLSVKCWADGKIALTLKNDLNIPAKNIKSVGCWIYNPSSTAYSTTLYYYKGAGNTNNQQAKDFTLAAGQWTFCQCGVSGLLADTDTFYNFQFYTQNVNTTLVFDNFCIYM